LNEGQVRSVREGHLRPKSRQAMAISLQNLKIRQQIFLLTLPLILVLFGVIGLFFFNYWQINRINHSVENSELSALRTESLLQGFTEMDTVARAYLLTGRESFLRDYATASHLVSQNLDSVRDLNSRKPAMLAELESLQKQVEDWKTQMADPAIERAKTGGGAAGLSW